MSRITESAEQREAKWKFLAAAAIEDSRRISEATQAIMKMLEKWVHGANQFLESDASICCTADQVGWIHQMIQDTAMLSGNCYDAFHRLNGEVQIELDRQYRH